MLNPRPTHSPRMKRVWMAALVTLVLLALVVAALLAALADVERYRPQLLRALEQGAGHPVLLGEIQLAYWPRPHVDVSAIEVTGEGWTLTAEHMRAWVKLLPLITGRARLSEVTVQGLRLAARAESLYTLPMPTAGAGAVQNVSLEHVHAPGAEIWLNERRVLQGDLELTGVLTPQPALRFDGYAPELGEAARVSVVAKGADGELLLEAARLDTTELLPEPLRLPIALSVRVAFRVTQADGIEAGLAANIAGELDALSGTGAARLWWREGRLILNDLALDTPALALRADTTWHPGEAWALRVHSLEAGAEAFPGGEWQIGGLRVQPGVQARITGEGLLLALGGGKPVHPAEGSLQVSGLDLLNATGAVLLRDVSAKAHFEPAAAVLERFQAEGLDAAGRVDVGGIL